MGLNVTGGPITNINSDHCELNTGGALQHSAFTVAPNTRGFMTVRPPKRHASFLIMEAIIRLPDLTMNQNLRERPTASAVTRDVTFTYDSILLNGSLP